MNQSRCLCVNIGCRPKSVKQSLVFFLFRPLLFSLHLRYDGWKLAKFIQNSRNTYGEFEICVNLSKCVTTDREISLQQQWQNTTTVVR